MRSRLTAALLVSIALLTAIPSRADDAGQIAVEVVTWSCVGQRCLLNVEIDGKQWTLQGTPALDPGSYHGRQGRERDQIWIRSADMKGRASTSLYRVVAHSWITFSH